VGEAKPPAPWARPAAVPWSYVRRGVWARSFPPSPGAAAPAAPLDRSAPGRYAV